MSQTRLPVVVHCLVCQLLFIALYNRFINPSVVNVIDRFAVATSFCCLAAAFNFPSVASNSDRASARTIAHHSSHENLIYMSHQTIVLDTTPPHCTHVASNIALPQGTDSHSVTLTLTLACIAALQPRLTIYFDSPTTFISDCLHPVDMVDLFIL